MNVRFCWRYEPFFFFLSALRTALDKGACLTATPVCTACAALVTDPQELSPCFEEQEVRTGKH